MAMNKKEQAEFAQMARDLRAAKALRYSTEPAPKLIPPPSDGSYVQGWVINSYSVTVDKCTTSSAYHLRGYHVEGREQGIRSIAWSQNGISMYATEHDAWAALRKAKEAEFALKLAEIDAKIEELRE
jgi:hypothetical protein